MRYIHNRLMRPKRWATVFGFKPFTIHLDSDNDGYPLYTEDGEEWMYFSWVERLFYHPPEFVSGPDTRG